MNRATGIALLVVGIALLYWGYNESQSMGSQLQEAFRGSPTDRTMMFYIGGAVGVILGGFLTFKNFK
jgi:hypothetical protein